MIHERSHEKKNLHCHSDQTYETFRYMWYCVLQFKILTNMNSSSRKMTGMKKTIHIAPVIKFMKRLFLFVTY